MSDKIIELLIKNNILSDKKQLVPITVGAGGASVFSVADKYVVKYANLSTLDFETRKQYRNEFDFYQICSNKNFDFIPEVIFQTSYDDEMLIIMKKYIPIKVEEWDENLQKSAMELCANINAVDTTDFISIFQDHDKKIANANDGDDKGEDPYPLSLSYQNWVNLQKKFPEHIDAVLLKEMYENFDNIDIYTGKQTIPETLCHGDYHPQNFLKNGDKLIICDWQAVGIGKGIGDIAFFISRGIDMGLKVDRDKLIADYYEALLKYTNIKVDVYDLHKNVAANEFGVSFRFWAHYLENSDIDRVLNIYNAMVKSYGLLLRKKLY